MFTQRGPIHKLINAQKVYCQGKEEFWYPELEEQHPQINISKPPNRWKLLKIENPINRRKLPATVTVTAKLKESARICGAATRGINFNKFKHKMANTLSVMTNVLRNVVSKQRIRYKENGYNLDLAYICDNIIAMGYPADNIESIFRNRLEDVYKFLQEIHQNHYKIYNLCLERSYDSNKFHGRVAVYPFEDHNPPTIELIQRFCMDVDTWLKADTQNVAAVHCKAGKGRTGTMICCYLIFSGQQKTAEDALECYAEKRTKDRKGVTIPSQRRYVQYFAKLIRSGIPYEKRILQFCEIRFTEANLLHSHGTVHCSISVLEDNGCTVKVMTLLGLPIDFRKSYTLDLKNHSLCVAGDIKVELTHKKKLFHFWFNTYFVRDEAVEEEGDEAKLVYTLNKCEIDDAHKDKEHKCFSEDFKVQLVFYAENSMRPGLQANVSSIVSQISNNQRKSQNQRLSHQGSSGGGDSSSSSNCQLPQNSSSGSDLNYICDQKSSSSASASVSSFCGPLVGGGSGSIGGASVGDAATNADYLCIDRNHDGGVQFMQLQQQQQHQNKWMSVSNIQQQIATKKSNINCDGYEYDSGNTPYRRMNTASTAAYALTPQQQQQHVPPHTYVNLAHIMAETENQHLHQNHQQKHHHHKPQQQQQLIKSSSTSSTNHTTPALASNTFMFTTATQHQQQNNVNFMTESEPSGGFSSNKNIETELQRGNNTDVKNNIGNSRQVERGTPTVGATTTTIKQSNGESNGCISANSSKSSISSQSSTNSATTTSSASSAPISTGEHDCEEEDWESGECQPNSMTHTVAHKTQLQLSNTLLLPSKPPTMAKSTSSDITLFNTKTSISTINTSNYHTPQTISQNPISILSSNFYMNTINSNSGSFMRRYCCCDDDENNPNIKCECKLVQEMEKLHKITNDEQRSSCSVVVKPKKGTEYVFRSLEDEDENRSSIGWTAESNNTTKFKSADYPICKNASHKTTSVCITCDNATYQRSITSTHDKPKKSMIPTKKSYVDAVTNSNPNNLNHAGGGGSISLPNTKQLFQQKFCAKKLKDCIGISSQQSTAIDVIKNNVYGGATTTTITGAPDSAVLALSCSPASGCGGLAGTSRRKLKTKFKNNTKKLSLWLQSHFRANPVEFCENFAQHTTASMRRNSNCSVGSRSRKLSVSSTIVTVTPSPSSMPKRQLLMVPSAPPTKNSNEAINHIESYKVCYYKGEENVLIKHDGSLELVCAGASAVTVNSANANKVVADNVSVCDGSSGGNGGARNDVERTKVSISGSMTASNFSLSTIGGETGIEHGGDSESFGGSCDTFEDFYSSNCDNQLSFNNSPCKSPRSLVDIGGSIVYRNNSHEHLSYANSLNERNVHLQMKRDELNSMQQRNIAAVQPTSLATLAKQEQQQQLHHLNVVVVAAKPAKTHAIGFNVATNERTQLNEEEILGDVEMSLKDVDGNVSDRKIISEDITIARTTTFTKGKEDNELFEQQKRILKYHFNTSSDMLDTKIDEVDEDCDDNDDGVKDENFIATSSSVYFTPSPTGMKYHEDNEIKKPFIFPKMQCELVKISYSNDNVDCGASNGNCHGNHIVDLATKVLSSCANNKNAYEQQLEQQEQGQHLKSVDVNELSNIVHAPNSCTVSQNATEHEHHSSTS